MRHSIIAVFNVWNGFDWIWLEEIPVKGHGLNRHEVIGNQLKSPALVVNSKTCQQDPPCRRVRQIHFLTEAQLPRKAVGDGQEAGGFFFLPSPSGYKPPL